MINAEYMNKVEDIYANNSSSIMTIDSMDYFDAEQYDIYDQKDYARFIKDAESACRNSFEYRQLIYYLRQTEGMNVCSFLNNVTNVDSNKVKIEIHHSPYTLYSICAAVIKKRLHKRESIDIFDIAKEIMWLHYMGYVGLIPLSETIHELVHNGYIFIPLNLIRGNYKCFTEQYYDYIDPADLDALDTAKEMTEEWIEDTSHQNNLVDNQLQILNLHSTYVKYKNIDKNQKIQTYKPIIKECVDKLKGNEKKLLYRLINK